MVTLMAKQIFHHPRRLAFDDAGNAVGNPADAALVGDQRHALQLDRRRLHMQCGLCVPSMSCAAAMIRSIRVFLPRR